MKQEHERLLDKLLKLPQNSTCADCGSKSPSWVSLDYGVFICMNCSGAHRALGPNNTRVKSTQLDTFQPEWVRLMRLGNTVCNQYWEHSIGDRKKPGPGSSLEDRHKFMLEKYIRRRYCPQGETDPITLLKEGRYEDLPAGREHPEESKQEQPPQPKIQNKPARQSSQQPVRSEKPKAELNWNQFLNPTVKPSKKPDPCQKGGDGKNAFTMLVSQASNQTHKPKPATTHNTCFDIFANIAPTKDVHNEEGHSEQKNFAAFEQQIHQLRPPQPPQQSHHQMHHFNTYSGGHNQAHFERLTFTTGIHTLQPPHHPRETFATGNMPSPYWQAPQSHSIPPVPFISMHPPVSMVHEQPTPKPAGGLLDNFNEFA